MVLPHLTGPRTNHSADLLSIHCILSCQKYPKDLIVTLRAVQSLILNVELKVLLEVVGTSDFYLHHGGFVTCLVVGCDVLGVD